jgi:predicted peroxiredoxin
LVFMAFKMLIVVSSGGFRLDLAKKLAKEAAGLGAAAGIVFIGNSLYGLRRKAGAPLGGMEGVAVMAHEVGLAERGIVASEIAEGVRIINDDELLELMIESERAMCF